MRAACGAGLCTGRFTLRLTALYALLDHGYTDLFTLVFTLGAMTAQRRSMLVLIVLSGVIISLCMGLRQSLGLFMRPMTLDLGVSAAAFGFSIALHSILQGLASPFVGALADRHGPRPVLIVTALVYVAGLLLMLVATSFTGALESPGFLIGTGTAGTGFAGLVGTGPPATPLGQRSQTVRLRTAAGRHGTMILAPLGLLLINGFGWRVAMGGLSASAGSIVLLSLANR